jgi:hypothetical protein
MRGRVEREPQLIASRLHTCVVLALLAAWVYGAMGPATRLGGATHPHRVQLYIFSIALEWLTFAVISRGVRRARTPLSCVLGERWQSPRELLRDILVAAAFWVAAMPALLLLEWLLRIRSMGAGVLALTPHGAIEVSLWIAVAVSAGICEETIFRGYLQRQLIVMTRSRTAGVVLAAAIFGLAHLYQGWRMAIVIGFYGLMFGVLAYWRRTVRPGMIAHAWHDALSGVVYSILLRH